MHYVVRTQAILNFVNNVVYIVAGVKNACSVNNGGCSHFCIPTPERSHVCACPDASNRLPVQPADGRNCLSSRELSGSFRGLDVTLILVDYNA